MHPLREHYPRVERRFHLPQHGVSVRAWADQVHVVSWAKRVAAKRGVKLSTTSKQLFGDGRRLDSIAGGDSYLRPPTLAKALERLDALERAASGEAPDAT